MKTSHAIATLLFAFIALLVEDVSACDCMATPSVEASLSNNEIDYVFRGYVQKLLQGDDEFEPKYYAVRVWRVFKGCTFGNATNIVVRTGSNSAVCGVDLTLKENYVFSGSSLPADPDIVKLIKGRNSTVLTSEIVGIGLCDFNRPFKPIPHVDKSLLWNSTNLCVKCDSAEDCPGGIGDGKYYCDKSKCVAYDGGCPPVSPWIKPQICLENPCLYAKPCTEATCIQDKCDTCGSPLWIDPNGNRVCQ
jgi:hypothetical protein